MLFQDWHKEKGLTTFIYLESPPTSCNLSGSPTDIYESYVNGTNFSSSWKNSIGSKEMYQTENEHMYMRINIKHTHVYTRAVAMPNIKHLN